MGRESLLFVLGEASDHGIFVLLAPARLPNDSNNRGGCNDSKRVSDRDRCSPVVSVASATRYPSGGVARLPSGGHGGGGSERGVSAWIGVAERP